MDYKAPDIAFSVPYYGTPSQLGPGARIEACVKMDKYFSGAGELLSGHGIWAMLIRSPHYAKVESVTYHIKKSTVVVQVVPRPAMGVSSEYYDIQIIVRGENRADLVEEMTRQFAEFKIPAKA